VSGDKIARVRAVLDAAEDVDLPEGIVAPASEEESPGARDFGHDGIDPGPPPAEDDNPPERRCVDFPLNDVGNGMRMIEHFGPDLVYVARVGWHLWTGTRFLVDPDEISVRRMAHKLSDLIAKETWYLPISEEDSVILADGEEAQRELDALGVVRAKDRTPDQVDLEAFYTQVLRRAKEVKDRRDKSIGRRLTHAKNAGNSNAIKNLLGEAAAIIARPLDQLDASALEVNTQSGVLRFSTRPGEDEGGANPPHPVAMVDLVAHDRAQLLTKIVPVDYDPTARAPRFQAFLDRIQPLPEMRRYLQRWFGYSMTGLTNEQKFAFFYGSGANGKSVLVDLMAKIMGDYAASAKIESITGRNRRGGGDATPDLIPLIGARFVRTSEPDEGQRLQEGLIKELTGGEPILVRALNENFVLVYPIFKLTISGNHKPEIHGGDDGIWRRVMLVPFEVQIPPDERDPDLGAKLWEERAGILNWLVEGLKQYLQHGLMVPDQVAAATAEYREDSDPLATFLTLCCHVTGDPTKSMPARELNHAFSYWMMDTGKGTWQPRTIDNKLTNRAGTWKSPVTGMTFTKRKSSSFFYDGIELAEPFRTTFQNAPRAQDGSPLFTHYGDR
jgi:putative DNA primase/helicase